MEPRKLLRIGVVGTLIAAVCCFTPALVVVLGAVGLAAAVGWLDYVLLPALATFAGISIYAAVSLRRRVRRRASS
jgi:mercuric ion transport protein